MPVGSGNLKGIRERRLYVYPGKTRAGVGLVVLDEGRVAASSVGSVPVSYVGPLSERFHPDVTVVPYKGFRETPSTPFKVWTLSRIRFGRSGWQNARHKYPFPVRHTRNLGPLAANSWSMMAHDVMTDKRPKIGSWNMSILSSEWLESNSPRRFNHDE